MNFAKQLIGLGMAAVALSSHAAILDEGFDNLATSGWTLTNNSAPAGLNWFQGNAGVFTSQSGADDSYAAANFQSANNGSGSIDNWLISPVLNLGTGQTTLTFYTRTDSTDFSDSLQVMYSGGASASTASFTTTLLTLTSPGYPDDWTKFTVFLPTSSDTARIAFRYNVGDANAADYIGIDSVSVAAAVPEPSTYALMALGIAGLGLVARRRSSAK
jgi:hypothetical protein